MFNSSLAHEMTAYIELRSAAFSNSLISNDKMALGLLDQYLIQTGFSGKKSDRRSPVGLGKNSFWKEQNGKRKAGSGAWLWKISEYIGICFISANTPKS